MKKGKKAVKKTVKVEDRSAFNCSECGGEGLKDQNHLCSMCNGTGKI